MKIVIVVATAPEAELLHDLGCKVYVSGIGAVNAALTAADAIRHEAPDLLVSAGIAGAYPQSGLQPGDVVVSSEHIYAALGAMDGEQFLDLESLGFPLQPELYNRIPAWEGAAALAERANRALRHPATALEARAAFGPILTLETVTGSPEGAASLTSRFPGALAEAMEGAGVAHAAWRAGLPSVEVRGISNPVGPRDRAGWRIREALSSLRIALRELPFHA